VISINSDLFYGMFAEYARKHGVDAAVASMSDGGLGHDVLSDLRERFEADKKKVQTGGPVVIAAGKPDWYSGPAPDDKFWTALYDQFVDEEWDDERLASVDAASDKVVAHTAQPNQPTWGTRGLVVGYVQSGKTTNFLATAAKLADLEYGLIIVLSGIHNALRKQTQLRMEAALKRVPAGAWFRLTEPGRDFVRPPADAAAYLMGNKTGVAVVKKNAKVLEKVKKWLETEGAKTALRERPILIIDDEADQASVETKVINPLIRDILRVAAKSTYIGYTATPFANVFINPYDKDDLYPRDFILSLPRPDGYFGPERIFGQDTITSDLGPVKGPEDGYDMVRIVSINDIPKLQPGSQDAEVFVPEITSDFADALEWFWLATAARRARSDPGHSSMLIHTSVKTAVHEAFRPVIEDYQRQIAHAVKNRAPRSIERLRSLWERESSRVPSTLFGRPELSFDEVLGRLPEVLDRSRVVLDNFRSKVRLDYEAEESQVVIAVGGNTLSRGLTLEGLVVSFFIRAAKTYDTLMQMGRWFGYRHGYDELPRIWMTDELRRDFRHLSRVEYEMRDDIERYQREDITPEQAAVRISTHPALRITAKMGAASPRFVSFEGRRFQTRYFEHGNVPWLQTNLSAAERLLQDCQDDGLTFEKGSTGAHLFRNVPVAHILRFLSNYKVHKDSPDLDTTLLRRYIQKSNSASEPSLRNWSVAVVEAPGGSETTVAGRQFEMVTRGRVDEAGADGRADIKTLMSKEDRVADLDLSRAAARAEKEIDLSERRNADPAHKSQGLLVLYFIDPQGGEGGGIDKRRKSINAPVVPVGIGLVFPGQTSSELRVEAAKVSVDLSELEVPDDRAEGMDDDTEIGGDA
jgi:hypothetical protein